MKILTETSENKFLVEMSDEELWNIQSQYTKDFMYHYGLRISDLKKDIELDG